MAQQVLDGAQLEAGICQQHRGRTLRPAKGHRPQTADTPPCAPTPASPAGVTPVQGNVLKCSQRAAVIILLLCHPDSEALGIDAVLHNLLRLQPSSQCLSLGCCRVAEVSSAALGHSTSREMLRRASYQGLGPSCTNRTAQGVVRASGSPQRAGGRSHGPPWLQWAQPGQMKVALMSVSLGHQCRGLVTAPGKERSWLRGWPRGK